MRIISGEVRPLKVADKVEAGTVIEDKHSGGLYLVVDLASCTVSYSSTGPWVPVIRLSDMALTGLLASAEVYPFTSELTVSR